MSDSLGRYKSVQVQTASPETLVVMLYDGIIRFVGNAQQQIQAKKYDQADRALARAQDIITELMITLNHDVGGEIAKNLAGLYEYCMRRLIDGNVAKSVEPLEEVLSIVRPLRDAWAQVAREQRAQVGAGAPR